MTGLIYKEWRHNRLYIVMPAVFGMAAILVPILITALNGDGLQGLTGEQGTVIRIIALLLGFLSAGTAQNFALRGDDRKAWAVFIASSPETADGFLRIKYEMIFAMSVLIVSSCVFLDQLLSAVVFDVAGKGLSDISSVYMTLAFLQIFLRAIDIPFIIRFGYKRGIMIKTIIVVVLFIMLTVTIMVNREGIGAAVKVWLENGFDKELIGRLTTLFPFVALAAYFLSYYISCRIYMKGVEQYDK